MNFVSTALKAVYAGVAAGLSGLGTVLVGNTTISDVTAGQWVSIAVFALGAFGAVYGVTNKGTEKP